MISEIPLVLNEFDQNWGENVLSAYPSCCRQFAVGVKGLNFGVTNLDSKDDPTCNASTLSRRLDLSKPLCSSLKYGE